MSEFRDAVAKAVENTPYTVEDTKNGFTVHLDVVDARWWGLFGREGLTSSFSWRVKERGSSFTIYDRKIRMQWVAGAPRLAGTMEYQGGRIVGFTREKIWALSDRGVIEPVVDYRFNSREGRDLIRLVAKQLGLRERLPMTLKLTAVCVLITPAFFAVWGIVVLVQHLLGIHL
ncbi:hypothetical protein E3G68_005242 [Mycobacteroides abscessus]|uniref:hypothetical protein n=1 Tax=Mycobacteroides abscessus TaxID=36809 RepID=UPI00187837DE|nr:hypothetical protein [Mycobacteroides abscessus]